MSLPLLIGGSAECGPSANNPLRGLAKNFDKDRGVQQVGITHPTIDPTLPPNVTFCPGSSRSKPRRAIFQPGEIFLKLRLNETKRPVFQTFRTHANPLSSENIKEAASFFSASNSAPLLHTPPSSFDFSDLQNALPTINHQGLQAPKSFPEIQQQSTNLSAPAWASDFMSFQQTQSSSSKQLMATPPSVRVQTAQRQTFQNPGLSS